jgi:hypothetical protein
MANTMTLIASYTVGAGGASSIDFTSISSAYTDLKIIASTRMAGSSANYITLNGSSSTFTNKLLYGNGGVAVSAAPTGNRAVDQNDSSTTASTFSNLEIYIPNYAGSNNKSFSQDGVTENNGTTAYAEMWASLWSTTSAITSLSLTAGSSTFVQYSTAYLYGIKSS